jgi:hypothetical protein
MGLQATLPFGAADCEVCSGPVLAPALPLGNNWNNPIPLRADAAKARLGQVSSTGQVFPTIVGSVDFTSHVSGSRAILEQALTDADD